MILNAHNCTIENIFTVYFVAINDVIEILLEKYCKNGQ